MTEGYQNLRNHRPLRPPQTHRPAEEELKQELKQDLHQAPGQEPKQQAAVTQGLAGSEPGHSEQAKAEKHAEVNAEEHAEKHEQVNGQETGPVQAGEEQRPEEKTATKKVDIVAELSANHRQDLDLAFRTLRAMAEAGADAIKLQSYDSQSLTLPLDRPPFIIESDTKSAGPVGPWDGRSFYSLYEEAAMPWAWHKPLYKLAARLGLPIFSTPFCPRGVDFLEQLETPCYKIASFEIGHLELVRRVAATGKPIIVSLGIAGFADIERFLEVCEAEGNSNVTLLQCTSAYPASPAEANLAMLPHLKSTFGCRVGLSDHTPGSAVAVAAVALGAELIEKHFILSRDLGGPDAGFSMEPAEFGAMVANIRTAEAAIGRVDYRLTEKKQASRYFGRAIFVLRDLRAGDILRREDVSVLRPCPSGAIEPWELERLLGSRLHCDVSYGTALKWHMLAFSEDS
ncbi:pseudaminic acid synthase [Candidatus Haliotispira prima]|uniref:Pseudaminic acid synthase n=1 Tax=Candidatus Haliotispira prima TaxID=3034016 RepID=A0ABY8MFN4_9SPIO|nr:pseudaminic acid synthase [Candidatus Haliotispira prima]